MSKFVQDFSNARLKTEYKLIDGHVVEVGKIDLQELYNSMLPNSLDSILKAFLQPEKISVVDETITENSYQSFEDLVDSVNSYAEREGIQDLSFSEILNCMIDPLVNNNSEKNQEVNVSGSGGSNNE